VPDDLKDDLKKVCRALGLDDSGRAKQVLVDEGQRKKA
jgi:hypothetical protein